MNSEPLFNDLIGVLAVITMIPVFFLWLEKKTKWKIFDILPAIIWIFLTPIFLSNLNVIPMNSEIYGTFRSFAVPLFIVLMLLDINIRQVIRVAWRGAGVLVLGTIGIVAGAVISFYLFQSGLPEDTWRGYGALAGSWIGGTGNLAAVAESLDTPPVFPGDTHMQTLGRVVQPFHQGLSGTDRSHWRSLSAVGTEESGCPFQRHHCPRGMGLHDDLRSQLPGQLAARHRASDH
jgi:hypothetical protein